MIVYLLDLSWGREAGGLDRRDRGAGKEVAKAVGATVRDGVEASRLDAGVAAAAVGDVVYE